MSRVLPILFNTEMVQAILEGRKTVTRRLVKPRYRDDEYGFQVVTRKNGEFVRIEKINDGGSGLFADGTERIVNPPCVAGDILYIRETWNICSMWSTGNRVTFIYRADEDEEKSARTVSVSDKTFDKYGKMMHGSSPDWRPSIHMPKEAARIFLKVKDVRVECLQDVTDEDAYKEGAGAGDVCYQAGGRILEFAKIWNSTIKKNDIEQYGWNANPWVWVIEFERYEKPESENE